MHFSNMDLQLRQQIPINLFNLLTAPFQLFMRHSRLRPGVVASGEELWIIYASVCALVGVAVALVAACFA